MNVRLSSTQERGLIVLIAVAIVAVGISFYAPVIRHTRVSAVAPIIVENAHVIVPRFLSSRPKININNAGLDELTRLPGIGETLAARIIAYRAAHGPFTRVEELKAVSGIGDKVVTQIRALVMLEEKKSER